MVDVLILSTYDTDGAGKFTLQLSDSLQRLGYSTKVVCVQSRSGDDKSRGIVDGSRLRQFFYRLRAEFDRLIFRPRPEYAFIHMRDLNDRIVEKSDVWPNDCKLIICTFLSGMMSMPALLAIRKRYKNPPVIFYGVDMNFYTAGCHYSRDCMSYQLDCSNCPAVPSFARAGVRQAFQIKLECYRQIVDPVVVASSNEHHQQILSSRLLGSADVRRILMAVDGALYGGFEKNRNEVRKNYGFSGRVMLIRSSSEPRKGCDMFIEAIRALYKAQPGILDGTHIVAIGDHYIASQLRDVDVHLYSPGYIENEQELARLYAAADFFLNTSLADGGPVMLAQALMSGTSVITTDVGLARDLVFPPHNGYILSQFSAIELSQAIAQFCGKSDAELQFMRGESRKKALEKLGGEEYLLALSALVKELLGE